MRERSPHELMDVTVRDYLRDSARLGRPLSSREATALALRDCHIFEAVKAETRPSGPSAPDPAKEAEKRAEVDRQAAELGTEIDRGQVETRYAPIELLHKKTKHQSRASLMKGRLARILSGTTPSLDPKVMCSTAEMPALALEIHRVNALVTTRMRQPRPGDEPNPFFGLSDVDVNRLATAMLENICDRSTGRLGPWLVPK